MNDTCPGCKKKVSGQTVTALKRNWHPPCFVCKKCAQSLLGKDEFMEQQNQPYCKECYHNTFSPKCAKCNEAIKEKCVTAMDKTWHPEHFQCAKCSKPIDVCSKLKIAQSKPYHNECECEVA
ncbi:transforming growth factor beta-1-induced transcript 1 protein-like isoform X2 [Varroa jacobsoni]|uniref:LIM zinc-binding domain-containing protein n=1 Tax=Varroa destructor TaxID=109461 RepID=A0A7M7M390_VARDE|nr:transforming growth factor beta-1-induced transcript 1 protein-like [Varroa destructor]XP_022695702.1 transforming growth factor beta-1-induced transcript 1 protein-like isoform X2 [Varroa jacobsoni]